MSENTNSNHIAKNKKEIVLKTPFDFQLDKPGNICPQTLPVNNEFNMDSCYANVLKPFTMKQADILSKFVGVMSEKHAENINKISSGINKRFDKFKISTNPKKHNVEGKAIIRDNTNTDKNMESTISVKGVVR